jgi:hypothetical protein
MENENSELLLDCPIEKLNVVSAAPSGPVTIRRQKRGLWRDDKLTNEDEIACSSSSVADETKNHRFPRAGSVDFRQQLEREIGGDSNLNAIHGGRIAGGAPQ